MPSPAKTLDLHCLCNSSVAFSPAWWGWGWGTELFSVGKTNLKERSFKDKRLTYGATGMVLGT